MRILIDKAASLLKKGNVVAVPTETVYGLAASLDLPQAIQDIYRLKGRPSNNPLIIHVAHFKDVFYFMQEHVSDLDLLARDFWPGPLTVILPIKTKLIPSVARANLPTAAFRIPQHSLALELLRKTGPLVMPSANLSGKPSSTQAQHVESDFGDHFPVLDGGACQKGLESTILHFHERWTIIRQGSLVPADFESTLGYRPSIENASTKESPICPGQLYKHYAPKAKLHLVDSFENISGKVIVGFSDRVYPSGCHLLSLGAIADPYSCAGNLYAILRKLDAENIEEAFVDIQFPDQGILATLLERLQRASRN